jgi:hypothetical protein
MPPVTASPDPPIHEPARNRSPRNDDRPNVPNFGPGRLPTAGPINVVTVCNHGAASGQKNKAAKRNMIADGFATLDPDLGKLSGKVSITPPADAATKLAY